MRVIYPPRLPSSAFPSRNMASSRAWETTMGWGRGESTGIIACWLPADGSVMESGRDLKDIYLLFPIPLPLDGLPAGESTLTGRFAGAEMAAAGRSVGVMIVSWADLMRASACKNLPTFCLGVDSVS